MHNNGQYNGPVPSDTTNEPRVLAPTWSVRETRKQFEQLASGPQMSNSFSGDLRPYRGRYKEFVDQGHSKMNDGLESFNALKLNEG